jgi:flagellar biosynthetic protein FliQ
MDEFVFYDTLRQGLWISVMMSMPILLVALVTGVLVGLFQALTSVQEMTLTFVPKLAAMLGVFWVTMGYMTESLTSFFSNRLIPLIGLM